jgi:hypothetical protein
MLQSLILIDGLSSAFREKEKKKNEKKARSFFPCLDMACWLCCARFLWLLGTIKG